MKRPWRAGLTWAGLCLLLGTGAGAFAAQDDARLTRIDPVLVTAPAEDSALRSTPHSVSVVTARDIEQSTATSINALLAREANVNLRSYFGNAKNATIDLRGMGEAAGSTVVVMVDGVRYNENDLSGADLSSLDLSRIERIEVLRGGGGVRHGDGAVGGVINIVTKRNRLGLNSGEISQSYGAYDTRESRLQWRTSLSELALGLSLRDRDSAGYRHNSGEALTDGSLDLRWLPSGRLQFLELYAKIDSHRDTYGMPGPISWQQFQSGAAARRSTQKPHDGGSTEEARQTLGAYMHLGEFGEVELTGAHRDRHNAYLIGFDPARPAADQRSVIEARRDDLSLRYELPLRAGGYEHVLRIGYDTRDAGYETYRDGRNRDGALRLAGTQDTRARYGQIEVNLPGALKFNAGNRIEHTQTDFVAQRYGQLFQEVAPGIFIPIPGSFAYRTEDSSRASVRDRASELGLNWQAQRNVSVFTSLSRHFRNPNLDERALSATDLRPQTGFTRELGLRVQGDAGWRLAATLFRIDIDDEIHYGIDALTGLRNNRNFDQTTQRRGMELEGGWQLTPWLHWQGSVGYVRPRFEGRDADIPLVPRTTASTQLTIKPTQALIWSLSLRYAGRRFDGDDDSNRAFRALPSYTVADTALRYTVGTVEWSVGVNNLFNRVYSTLSYAETYYPMPERNAYSALRWRF